MFLSAEALTPLLSPPILFFLLGLFAGIVKSDLEFPPAFGKVLSLYLMMAIGFKGGAGLVSTPLSPSLLTSIVAAMVVSFGLPFLAYFFLRLTTQERPVDCIAIAAHYGSTSLVTFITAAGVLQQQGLEYESHMVVLLALMETPAIFAALAMRRRWVLDAAVTAPAPANDKLSAWQHILFGGGAVMLLGSFLVGVLSGPKGYEAIKGFIVDPFQGLLCLFLLEMGLLAGRRIQQFTEAGWRLIAFGIYFPALSAGLGLALSLGLGLSSGGTFLFMVLCASASYIVVPAAMRTSIPEANPGLYVPLTLAVTFPFNIVVGIPVYLWLATHFVK